MEFRGPGMGPLPRGVSERDLGWLAGITDGEGSFVLGRSGRPHTHYPVFVLSSRYDDAHIQMELKRILGCGRINIRETRGRPNASPACVFFVCKINDLLEKVCPILDFCSFKSKKSIEYPLWKEAIQIRSRWIHKKMPMESLCRLEEISKELVENKRHAQKGCFRGFEKTLLDAYLHGALVHGDGTPVLRYTPYAHACG